MNTMTVRERVLRELANHLCIEESDMAPEKRLNEDLGADSLDIVELGMNLEDEFGIEIPDGDFNRFTTVGDVLAYVEGRLGATA